MSSNEVRVNLNKLWRDSGYITDPARLFDFQFAGAAGDEEGGETPDTQEKYTLDEIEDYIHKQRAYQLFRKKPSKLSGHITAFEINHVMQMDLLDFQKLKTRNKGYSWILNLIDVFSRKLYTRPLKNKTMGSVKEALTDILHQIQTDKKDLPRTIMSDNGLEFNNLMVKEVFSAHSIEHQMNEVGDHNALGIVDRISRTLREILQKHFEINKTANWVDSLQELTYAYNNRYHSTIKKPPNLVTNDDVSILIMNLDKASVSQSSVKPGDRVRVLLSKNIHAKGTKQKFSREIFSVVSVAQVNARLSNGRKVRIERLLKVKEEDPVPEDPGGVNDPEDFGDAPRSTPEQEGDNTQDTAVEEAEHESQMDSFMTNLGGPNWKEEDLNSNPRAEARAKKRERDDEQKTQERDDEQKTQERDDEQKTQERDDEQKTQERDDEQKTQERDDEQKTQERDDEQKTQERDDEQKTQERDDEQKTQERDDEQKTQERDDEQKTQERDDEQKTQERDDEQKTQERDDEQKTQERDDEQKTQERDDEQKTQERDDEQKTQEPTQEQSSLETPTPQKTNKRLKLLPPTDPSFERMKGIAQRAFPTLKPDILNDETQLRQFLFAQDRIRLSK